LSTVSTLTEHFFYSVRRSCSSVAPTRRQRELSELAPSRFSLMTHKPRA
jgi:hypothetical protein